jgi:SAM-dependent methyltransferase
VDLWKFFDITHRDHVVCNPTSIARLDELIGLLDLPEHPTVLDIGSGKGEFLLRLAERVAAPSGVGFRATAIDRSPFCVAQLREATTTRIPGANVDILEMDAAEYTPEPGANDLAVCLGASWIYGGHAGTLQALGDATRPGGQVLVGEPFWRHEPAVEQLEWSGLSADQFGTHASNVDEGERHGLVPLLAWVSTDADWDRYETLQWRAAARYAAGHPDDPDLPDLLERVRRNRHEYLTWGREAFGWAIYLFAKPA